MGSKTLAVIAIVLVVVVAFFVLDTGSLLNPILDGLSLRESEVTPDAILMVDGYVDGTKSAEDTYVIAYSVSNVGNASAQNVTLATVVDGETRATQQVSSLSVGDTADYSLPLSGENEAQTAQSCRRQHPKSR